MIGTDYYAIQEQNPAKLWKLPASGAIAAHSGDLADTTGYEIMSVGGLTRGGDATDEVFMVVKNYKGPGRDASESYNQAGIFRYKLSTNAVLERFGGEVCNMGQPEGLTFWKEGTKVKLRRLSTPSLSNSTSCANVSPLASMSSPAKVGKPASSIRVKKSSMMSSLL